ncbi:fumarylacetoacetate hydrolase family protein [Nonomuraea ceibae]|uniref:fumarylacetoacetate hydrolase family protein n=1 Tax=Nonomuraea ceibae TaxID=1935170 RepID=UPI001C5F0609|nr:fumarylacetoacetate hydrolase family protein [Nonomuraea ceibae]
MRLCRIDAPGGARLAIGCPEGNGFRVVPIDLVDPSAPHDPLDVLERPDRAELAAKAAELAATRSAETFAENEVAFAPPVHGMSKIVCLALNYRAHAQEGGFTLPDRPVIFLKGPNTLTGHEAEITVPPVTHRIDHEGELAVVVGRRIRNLGAGEDWRGAVAGYSIMNDLTARDLQLADIGARHPWDLSKSIDGYGPIGPWLVSPDEVPDPQDLDLEVRVDGEIRQRSSTGKMIFGVGELLRRLSALMTLERGDVIATGTPDGIGPVPDGGTVEVRIGTLGNLRNRVRFQREEG